MGPTDNKSALIKVTAWCRICDKKDSHDIILINVIEDLCHHMISMCYDKLMVAIN